MNPSKEQVEIYLKRRLVDLQNGQDALKKSDLFILEKIGHQIKGNGISFGFPELSELGEKMEMAAQDKNREKLNILLLQMETWLKTHFNSF